MPSGLSPALSASGQARILVGPFLAEPHVCPVSNVDRSTGSSPCSELVAAYSPSGSLLIMNGGGTGFEPGLKTAIDPFRTLGRSRVPLPKGWGAQTKSTS